MIYKMTLKDSTDEMTFNLLEVPIVDKDIEGAVDNVTLDGNQYTDYLYLKKQYIQKWSIMCDEEYERLRGFYTRQFDEAEIPTYELYYGETIYNEYTRSGDYILVDVQGVEPARMSLAQLNGNATQTTYSGKNLLNPVDIHNGAFTSLDAFINENWTETTNTKYRAIKIDNLPAGTYTFSINWSTTARIIRYVIDNQLFAPNINANTLTVTTTTDGAFGLNFRRTDSTDFADSSYTAQIESGSSVTDYEPYVGGIPAPNPSYPQPISVVTGENVVRVVGKNLFHFTDTRTVTTNGLTFEITEGTSVLKINGTSASSSNFSTNLIRDTSPLTLEAGTYTIKIDGLNRITNTTDYAYLGKVGIGAFAYMNPNNNWQTTFTLTEKTSLYMQGVFASSTAYDNKDVTIQLEQGNQATTYQAYTEQDYLINLGSIELAKIGTYQDRIYKDGEKWYVKKQIKKYVFDGSESWSLYSNKLHTFKAGLGADRAQDGICDHFVKGLASSFDVAPCFYASNTAVAIFSYPDMADVSAWTTWLSNHPTTVYYVLATPTTTEITDQTLIDQLEALVNISITTGIHNIFTEVASGNLNPVMILNFIEVVSRRVTLVPETPVRLALTDGGIINACGCRKDVQLTMRETIE